MFHFAKVFEQSVARRVGRVARSARETDRSLHEVTGGGVIAVVLVASVIAISIKILMEVISPVGAVIVSLGRVIVVAARIEIGIIVVALRLFLEIDDFHPRCRLFREVLTLVGRCRRRNLAVHRNCVQHLPVKVTIGRRMIVCFAPGEVERTRR